MTEPVLIPLDFKATPRVLKVLRIAATALQDIATVLEAPVDALAQPGAIAPAPVVAPVAPPIPSPDSLQVNPAEVFAGNGQTTTAVPSSAVVAPTPTAPTADTSAAPSPSAAPHPAPLPTSAATAPTAAEPAPVPAADRDVTGLPWDARIHSSSKGVNQDGTWKKKRGVQEIEFNKVAAELRAQGGVAPAPAAAASVAPAAPIAPAAPVAPAAPAAPVAPVAPAAPVADAGAPQALTFAGLMNKVRTLMESGRLTNEEVMACATGVLGAGAQLPHFVSQQDKLQPMADALDGMVTAKGFA